MPAVAQSAPEVRWRLTSSFPKSLDVIYGGAETLAKLVAEATDNRFQIQVLAPGEVVPGLGALDAVTSGTVEACHTAAYYYTGKDPTFAIPAAIPFGLNARQQAAWAWAGGGNETSNEFFRKYGVHGLPCGNTGAQMGGWFRREIKGVADLNGLKMRVGGLAGQVLSKLGVVPQQVAGGDIQAALEKGAIDAAEWVGPYDDERLGLGRAAKFYYYPGWWEGGLTLHAFFNLDQWNRLPKTYQAIVTSACAHAGTLCQARYDVQNPAAIKRLVAADAQLQLKIFPQDVLEACFRATGELYAEIGQRNEEFRRQIAAMTQFRADQYLWWQVAEYSFDNFMIRARARG